MGGVGGAPQSRHVVSGHMGLVEAMDGGEGRCIGAGASLASSDILFYSGPWPWK